MSQALCYCGHPIEQHDGTMGCCTGMVLDAEGCGDSCGCGQFIGFVPTGPCAICGDPEDHQGRPHGVATGDGMTRASALAAAAYGAMLRRGEPRDNPVATGQDDARRDSGE